MRTVYSFLAAMIVASGCGFGQGLATAQVKISEVSSSNSFGEDWFELTNVGDSTVDLTGYYWDDNGPMGNDGAVFGNISLAAGESLIVLEGGSEGEDLFRDLFDLDASLQVLTEDDFSGPDTFSGLSSKGDEISIWDTDPNAVGAVFTRIDFVAFEEATTGVSFNIVNGSPIPSVAGENGATTATNGDVGSPGIAIAVGSTPLLGDLNTDDEVDFLDISPFIAVLSTGDFQDEGDIDRNGTVDFLDISPFILILSGQ